MCSSTFSRRSSTIFRRPSTLPSLEFIPTSSVPSLSRRRLISAVRLPLLLSRKMPTARTTIPAITLGTSFLPQRTTQPAGLGKFFGDALKVTPSDIYFFAFDAHQLTDLISALPEIAPGSLRVTTTPSPTPGPSSFSLSAIWCPANLASTRKTSGHNLVKLSSPKASFMPLDGSFDWSGGKETRCRLMVGAPKESVDLDATAPILAGSLPDLSMDSWE